LDWEAAIHYARMVQAAKNVMPTQECAPTLTVSLRGVPVQYNVLATIYANDLATRHNEGRRELIVSIGFIAQDEDGHVVIALRGTRGIHEWIRDMLYFAVPCPFLPEAGCTEHGFTEVYMSLRMDAAHESKRLRRGISEMAFPLPVSSLTVCGHSLGAALATFLALDLAANTQHKDVSLYNFASPRTGDHKFAETFNRFVPKAYRIVNQLDLVTDVPRSLLSHETKYRHVESIAAVMPHDGVNQHLLCMHHLSTYTHLMAKEAGLNLDEYPLREECRREADKGWVRSLKRRARIGGKLEEKTKASLQE
jgi:hypothetical protein